MGKIDWLAAGQLVVEAVLWLIGIAVLVSVSFFGIGVLSALAINALKLGLQVVGIVI